MNRMDKLGVLMSSALERATIEKLKPVSAALIPVLPTVITGLRDVIVDPQSTATARLKALEMVLGVWSKCLRSEIQLSEAEHARNRHRLKTAQAAASRAQAKAEEKQAALKIAAEQRKIGRALKKAKEKANGQDIITSNH